MCSKFVGVDSVFKVGAEFSSRLHDDDESMTWNEMGHRWQASSVIVATQQLSKHIGKKIYPNVAYQFLPPGDSAIH